MPPCTSILKQITTTSRRRHCTDWTTHVMTHRKGPTGCQRRHAPRFKTLTLDTRPAAGWNERRTPGETGQSPPGVPYIHTLPTPFHIAGKGSCPQAWPHPRIRDTSTCSSFLPTCRGGQKSRIRPGLVGVVNTYHRRCRGKKTGRFVPLPHAPSTHRETYMDVATKRDKPVKDDVACTHITQRRSSLAPLLLGAHLEFSVLVREDARRSNR